MGQYWKLVNIDKEAEMRNDHGVKLWEIIANCEADRLLELLHVPVIATWSVTTSALRMAKHRQPASQLTAMPQELIDQILDSVTETGEDVLSIAMTCSYFLRLLAPTLRDHFIRDTAPWARDRLIFVGDYAGSIPEWLGTVAEKTTWQRADTRNPLYNLPKVIVGERKRTIFTFIGFTTKCNPDRQSEYGLQPKALLQNVRTRIGDTSPDLNLLETLIELFKPKPHGEAVLRNLTTKQYVRDSVIASSNHAYSLGEVICTRAQWTDDSSGTERLATHGDWAGHVFDIASVDDVDDHGWCDVSQEAVNYLRAATGREEKNGKRAGAVVLPSKQSEGLAET